MQTQKTLFTRHHARYLVPNLFTTGVLCAGFYACVQAIAGQFDAAAIAILVATILDGLDGRLARLMHSQSAFGAEYDSLADMVAFGAAPALLLFEWAFDALGLLGWTAALVYCIGAALRLARFNSTLAVSDKRWFQGLPSPAAAVLVASFVWSSVAAGTNIEQARWYAAALMIFAGLAMVSTVRFYSGKSLALHGRRSLGAVAAAIGLPVVLSSGDVAFPTLLFGLVCCYALSGFLLAGWRLARRLQ